MAPKVTIVLVNYGGRDDTLACLESLSRLTYPSWEAIVVDQRAGDEAPAAIRAAHPDVRVLENERNTGFTGGCNRGIDDGLERGAGYVCLLNNDTTVAPDLLERLVGCAQEDPRRGAIGPVALRADRPDIIWAAGGRMDRRGQASLHRSGESVSALGAAPFSVDYVVGCGLLLPRCALEAVGRFDERFFLYYEEADLCARLRAAGFESVIAPGARLWHAGSRSTGAESALTLYYMRRNRHLYLQKHGAAWARAAAWADDLRLLALWSARRDPRAATLRRAMADAAWGQFGHGEGFPPTYP